MICLHFLSLLRCLQGFRNNLCRRKCGQVTESGPFFGGGCKVGWHNVVFISCISRSGNVACVRLIKEQSKYFSGRLKLSSMWKNLPRRLNPIFPPNSLSLQLLSLFMKHWYREIHVGCAINAHELRFFLFTSVEVSRI